MDHFIYELDHQRIDALFFVVPDKPKQMYVRGTIPDERLTFLSVVGSRKPSRYGEDVTKHLIASLAGLPVCIVSGLALGIDSVALDAAIETSLPAIAIPGSGVHDNVLIPRSNLSLARKILQNGGCIMSEWDPPDDFPNMDFPDEKQAHGRNC